MFQQAAGGEGIEVQPDKVQTQGNGRGEDTPLTQLVSSEVLGQENDEYEFPAQRDTAYQQIRRGKPVSPEQFIQWAADCLRRYAMLVFSLVINR